MEDDQVLVRKRIWEGIAFSSIIAFFCALFIVTYKVESSDVITTNIAINKIMLWFAFSAAGGLSLYASDDFPIKRIIKITILPGTVLFITLCFVFFGVMIFNPVKSTPAKSASELTERSESRPTVYEENGEYFQLISVPNGSFAPLSYKSRVEKNDPVLDKAIIISITEANENFYSQTKVVFISISFFLLISLFTPIAMTASYLAKNQIVSLITWLADQRSGKKIENLEKNINRLISLLAVLSTLGATLVNMI